MTQIARPMAICSSIWVGEASGNRLFGTVLTENVRFMRSRDCLTRASLELRCNMLKVLRLCARRGDCLTPLSRQERAFCSTPQSKVLSQNSIPLSHPIYQIWGSNTDVGKTLVGVGLFRQACLEDKALYLKPVQTGFPEDSDARLAAAVAGASVRLGDHAAELQRGNPPEENDRAPSFVHTEFAWKTAVSPHLAVELEGRAVSNEELLQAVVAQLQGFAQGSGGSGTALSLVETAGGPASPGPSGSLQCNLYRPLRLPALLVGEGKLGGISSTLAAYEMLSLRGYDVAAIAVIEPASGPNVAAIQNSLASCDCRTVPVFRLPECLPPRTLEAALDPELEQWLAESKPELTNLLDHLKTYHADRVSKLSTLAEKTLADVWYPFTQHSGLEPKDVTVIDARSSEDMLVFKPGGSQNFSPRIEQQYDACASWWTQGMAGELHGRLVRETMKGVARFGHVIHPHTATEPTLELAQQLLQSVGKGWASRVFYSDNGSTAVEVALKMAFRKFWRDHPDIDLEGGGGPPCELRVLGIDGGYHGDTLGAMDAVAPSPYNGPAQFPWYKGRGIFLNTPYVGIINGQWQVKASGESQPGVWSSLEDLVQAREARSQTERQYRENIEETIDKYQATRLDNGAAPIIAACIIEPVLQGAGGMLVVDPLYQQCLVEVARDRKIPVIFDEVFSGIWRLGRVSAAEILGQQPDIACYAKLLTGGLIPMSATVASSAIFDAFKGDTKLQALLHGHSYSGHVAGASAGVAALKIFSDPALNPALEPGSGRLRQLWPSKLVIQISHLPLVDSVIALGTVLAVELKTADGGGYASGASAEVVKELRSQGIFARPLGNTVYLMVTPTTSPATASALLQALLSVLESR